MRAPMLLCLVTVLLLVPGTARGQRSREVMKLDGVEQVSRLVVATDGSFHVVARVAGQPDPVVISSTPSSVPDRDPAVLGRTGIGAAAAALSCRAGSRASRAAP